jgi:DivIVA domain-containing protein
MAITPQAIKDQEFQVKFRGFDAIEVKAYLELIAEEFFELFERVRKQVEEIEELGQEKEELIGRNESLQRDISTQQGKYDQVKAELSLKSEGNSALVQEIADLKARITDLEKELGQREEDLSAAKMEIQVKEAMVENGQKEKLELNTRFVALEKQWQEQKNIDIDFKETILAAQHFSRDLKKRSEEEAGQILEKARAEAEKMRSDTYNELARFPKEIERLKIKRDQVREDLKTVLTLCLENLDIFSNDKPAEQEEDYSDLFQSVTVSDDGTVSNEEMAILDMDLDLPASFDTKTQSGPAKMDGIETVDVL